MVNSFDSFNLALNLFNILLSCIIIVLSCIIKSSAGPINTICCESNMFNICLTYVALCVIYVQFI